LVYIPLERFERITKELCNFPTFFHKPLYERILMLWSTYYHLHIGGMEENLPPVVTYGVFHYFWKMEMAPFDKNERFFRLLKRPEVEYITRDDFFPYIKELLNDHPVSFCCVFCVYWFVCASVCLDVLCLLLLLLLLLIHSIYRG
jgi:serine/threonine-protein phosphatase 2A regulatory subunit B''